LSDDERTGDGDGTDDGDQPKRHGHAIGSCRLIHDSPSKEPGPVVVNGAGLVAQRPVRPVITPMAPRLAQYS
jgi:hypothetical protein